MILSAHQPAYIPWAGYIHKIISSDLFIILDNVQYEKNSFINRNYLLINNEPKLITVPVELKSHLNTKINDIKISNTKQWGRKHLKAIQLNYKKSPFFNKHIDFFEEINFNLRLALAAASFISPREDTNDFVKGKSIFIPLIGKLFTARCV